jgi:peptidoglycan/LPS O-acetylase OafA/YrhL
VLWRDRPGILIPICATALAATPVLNRNFAFFENVVSGFLGKISFPLYLIQAPIICSFGSIVYLSLLRSALAIPFSAAITLIVSAAVSILAAIILLPIERLAIKASRSIPSLFIKDKWLKAEA